MAEGSANLLPGVAWTSNKALDAFEKTAANAEMAKQKKQASVDKAQQESSRRAIKEATSLSDLIPSNIWEQRDGQAIRSELNELTKQMDGKWELYGKGDPETIKIWNNIKMDIGAKVNKSAQDKEMYNKMNNVMVQNPDSLYTDEKEAFMNSTTSPYADVPVITKRPDFHADIDKAVKSFRAKQKESYEQEIYQSRKDGRTVNSKLSEASEKDRKEFVKNLLDRPGYRREVIEELGGPSFMEGRSEEAVNQMVEDWAEQNIYPDTEYRASYVAHTGAVEDTGSANVYVPTDPSTWGREQVSYVHGTEGDDGTGATSGAFKGESITGINPVPIQTSGTSGDRFDFATGNLMTESIADKGIVSNFVVMNVDSGGKPTNKRYWGKKGKETFAVIRYKDGHSELTNVNNIKSSLEKVGFPVESLDKKPGTQTGAILD